MSGDVLFAIHDCACYFLFGCKECTTNKIAAQYRMLVPPPYITSYTRVHTVTSTVGTEFLGAAWMEATCMSTAAERCWHRVRCIEHRQAEELQVQSVLRHCSHAAYTLYAGHILLK